MRQVSHIDEDFAEFIPAFPLQLQRTIEIFVPDQTSIDENLSQWCCGSNHVRVPAPE